MDRKDRVIDTTRRDMLKLLSLTGVAGILTVAQGALSPVSSASTPRAAGTKTITLLLTWTPAQIKSKKGEQQPRKRFIELAGVLDMYNKGLLGPGHCSE